MKRLLLFVAIAAFIGIGIFVLGPQQAAAPANEERDLILSAETARPTEQEIKALIVNIIGSQFNVASANHTLVNLDQKGGYELIVSAIEDVYDPFQRPISATIQIVTLQDGFQQFDRIGSVTYREWMRGVPEIKELKDVTGDGQPEIIASLMYGGASSSAEGILQANLSSKQLRWLQLQSQDGKTQNAIFQIGGSATHWNTLVFKNLDSDALAELIEIYAQVVPYEDKGIQCEVHVSKWDGLQFVHSMDLSTQTLSSLNENCEL